MLVKAHTPTEKKYCLNWISLMQKPMLLKLSRESYECYAYLYIQNFLFRRTIFIYHLKSPEFSFFLMNRYKELILFK